MTVAELKKEFESLYGAGGEIRIFHSPGRVNLIGEHTDYNGGYVFPAALSMGSTIALRLPPFSFFFHERKSHLPSRGRLYFLRSVNQYKKTSHSGGLSLFLIGSLRSAGAFLPH